MIRSRLTSIVIVAAIGLTGCGGDSSDELSSDELIKKADAICKDVNEKTAKLATPTDIGTAGTTIAKTRDILVPAQDELADLRPPADTKAAYDAWVKKTGEVLEAAESAEKAAKRNDPRALGKQLRAGVKLTGQARSLARDVGLEVCGAGGS